MNIITFLLIQFFLAILLVLLYYKFVEARGIEKYTKKNIPVDLKLFIQLEHVDVKKISYKKLMKIVAVTNAIDIGIVLLITNVTDNLFFKFLIAVPAVFIILYISYNIVGFILKKKGMTLNES